MEYSKISNKVDVANIEDVTFGDAVIRTQLDTGYDGDAPEKHRRTVSIVVHLDDDAETIKNGLDRLAASIRIKMNQVNGRLKGAPAVYDAESYAEFLDRNDCHFEVQARDIFAPTKRKKTPGDETREAADKMLEQGLFTKEQHEEAYEIAAEQDAKYDAAQ